jgi:hypothetical protein
MMAIPSWLADTLAGVMLATAVYCAARLVVARVWHRVSQPDIDGTHVLMGVGMAGMLVSALDPWSATTWEILFAITTAWFAWRAISGWSHPGALGHGTTHMLTNGAMLYMYLATPAHATAGGMSGMSGGMSTSGSSGGTSYPTIGLLLTLFLTAYAVLSADRITLPSVTGPANHADHGVMSISFRGRKPESAAIPPPPDHGRSGSPEGQPRRFLAPRTNGCCHVAMAVTMAYMLVTML